jgi:PAS domain S-box-containing protein
MTSAAKPLARHADSRLPGALAYALELVLIAAVYFALARAGLALASIHPSATPIWPPSGFALAVLLLRGYRVWPAILAGAFLANALTAGAIVTSLAIAAGNAIEALVGAYLVNRWSGGRDTFETPAGIVRFVFIAFLPTMLGASIGVSSLALGGAADWRNFGSIWLTWWLGDLAGVLVITPVVVLWATSSRQSLRGRELLETMGVLAGAAAIGLLAFSPLIEQTARRAPLGFLAILPLLWSALRRGQRDTATVSLILSCFAVWAAVASGGPFEQSTLNESFLLVLMFMIATVVPSLALSADVAVRKRTEDELLRIQEELNQRVDLRTAALLDTNRALHEEVEHRKEVEGELQEQRLHLVEAQRLANLGSFVRDVENDRLVWSDQLFDLYGVQREQFAGTFEAFLQLVHPEDRDRLVTQVGNAVRSGQGFHVEMRIVRPDGAVRYLQSSGEPVKDKHGRVVRILGISQDISARKEAEAILERTREQLAQVQKMEAIGQLTGGIAHDFNNLLMIVSGHAEMLRRKLSDQKQLQSVEAIQVAARRGENLTRQLLTFARRQPLNPAPIDLKQRIEAVRDMLSSSLRGDIALLVDIPDDIWPVEADVAELELALVNIAVNARDAMPHGGSFTVSARNVAERRERAGESGRDHIELTMSDTGEGMPPDIVAKIFDPFFTTKEVGKGTGLGLSQVYGFAQQSGGTVGVKSEVGRGTAITLCLPRSHAAVMVEPKPASPQPTVRAEGTILVVEDNPDVADVSSAMLQQMGYRVLRADDGNSALRTLQNGEAIDLLFSDIVMPNGMNGIELAEEVSRRFPHLRILLTTGYSDVAVTAKTRFTILRKPFEVSALERAVRDALATPSIRIASA